MLIAQLSDPHLRPHGALYQGLVDSNAMFEAAVRQLNALSPRPDVVLVSGDLVDEGSSAEYAVASAMLSRIEAPVLVVPGNHDEREAFRRTFAERPWVPASGPIHFVASDHGPVRIVGLDVTVPGRHHGEMTDEACDWLSATLRAEPDRPTVVMMHQPPCSSGIACIDAFRCLGGDRLAAILVRYPAVERILCGHIHRCMQVRFAGTLLCTAPSTVTAIALRLGEGSTEGESFIEPPAMLLHRWLPGTGLVTHLLPIGSFPGPLPFW